VALDIPVEHYQTDVLVVGGGAAGAMACFECADAGVKVILAGKSRPPSGTTSVARGGFAAAMGPDDSPELHLAEILEHGGELIDPELARVWCEGIIDVVKDLQAWGAEFVTKEGGELDLKMFPNHSKPRAVHHFDTTGNMVTKTLAKKLRPDQRIEQHANTAMVDLVVEDGRVVGAWGVNYGTGSLVAYSAKEVILCTGGGSGLFYVNDNPPQVTGDGYVMGFRAGVPLLGIEMIDFQAMCCSPEELFGFAPHPTGFINAGAVFRNRDGELFLKRYFPDTAERSTRSEVILAMAKEIHAGRAGLTGGIFMDATEVPLETIQKQIPHVYKTCLHRGIDITETPLEVAPGSHTWLGGLKIDVDGKTPLDGLWAAGETGGGIHGGNRIGGSALSSALVFGRRAGKAASAIAKSENAVPAQVGVPDDANDWLAELIGRDEGPLQEDVRLRCRMLAHEQLGSIRSAEGCTAALAEYAQIEADEIPRMRLSDEAHSSEKARGQELESALSVKNLALLGRLLATASLAREESRGAHYRIDFPDTDEVNWNAVTRLEQGPDGEIALHKDPLKQAVPSAAA
jgi:fumarate reductase (CoM/CoB) subunit A